MSIAILTSLLVIVFLFAALPLRNWFEIKRSKINIQKWDFWLKQKPSKTEFLNKFSGVAISCDFCNSIRQFEELEMVLPSNPNFGPINNSFSKYLYYKRFICSGCGTELYRDKYEN